jgi:hypothetical protein
MQSVALMIAFAQLVSVGAFAPLPMMSQRSKVIGLRCVSQGSVSPNLVLQPFQDKSALKVVVWLCLKYWIISQCNSLKCFVFVVRFADHFWSEELQFSIGLSGREGSVGRRYLCDFSEPF